MAGKTHKISAIYRILGILAFVSFPLPASSQNIIEIDGEQIGGSKKGTSNSSSANGSNDGGTVVSSGGASGPLSARDIASIRKEDGTADRIDPNDPQDWRDHYGDADGGNSQQHHDDIAGSSWLYMNAIASNQPTDPVFSGVNFFYRDEVTKHFKPGMGGSFRPVIEVEVGCKGRRDRVMETDLQLVTNNEGDGSKRIYEKHGCHIHKCKKSRLVCWGVFVTVTAGKELLADKKLQAPLPPDFKLECHGSTYWKAKSSCRVISHNGDGYGGPSTEEQMRDKTTVNSRTPATLAPDKDAEGVYKDADFLKVK